MNKKPAAKNTGFKGLDKDFKCRDYQFEVGKTFTHEGSLQMCASGFHFCEHPLDVFSYYDPACGRFAEVETDSDSGLTHNDSKRVCGSITIKAEISFSAMIASAVKFVFDRADWSKKEQHAKDNSGAASATGDSGAASATGYRGAASATGYSGAASATGEQGCAVALGIEGKAKGIVGAWLTIAEWKHVDGNWERIDVQTVKIDGKKIKAETWYWLVGGKFTEV